MGEEDSNVPDTHPMSSRTPQTSRRPLRRSGSRLCGSGPVYGVSVGDTPINWKCTPLSPFSGLLNNPVFGTSVLAAHAAWESKPNRRVRPRWTRIRRFRAAHALHRANKRTNRVCPRTAVQTCIVHLIRNSMSFVAWKDRRKVMPDLKAV